MREFEGFHDIPVCYQPTTDPLVLMGLLEAVRHARLSPLYATLGRISEGARTVKDIIENSKRMEEKSRSGFIKDACYTLRDLLERLDSELSSFRLSTTLELRDRTINVMPVNSLSNEAQQLVVKTALELVIRKHNRKTIVIVDEAFRFFPQDYGSACKKAGMDVITQGAKTGLFIWISTQFLATTEKDIMKPCANKILGRQDHNTEIEALMKLVPHAKSLINADEIMTLRRGEFIFVPLEGKPVKLKVVPPWEREPTVGQGKPTVTKVITAKDSDGPVIEREAGKEKTVSQDDDKTVSNWEEPVGKTPSQIHNAQTALDTVEMRVPKEVRSQVQVHLPSVRTGEGIGRTSQRATLGEASQVNLDLIEIRYMIHHKEDEQVDLSTKTQEGKIMYVMLNDLQGQASSIGQIKAALIERAWPISDNSLPPGLAGLVKQGILVREGKTKAMTYRVPKKAKISVVNHRD
jgi:hypothetical protein